VYPKGAFGFIGPPLKVYVNDPGTGTGTDRVFLNESNRTAAATTSRLWPASRAGHSSWMDSAGRFYIFGGVGTTPAAGPSMCAVKQDLWRYEPHSAVPYPAVAGVYEWQQLQSDALHTASPASSAAESLCTAAYLAQRPWGDNSMLSPRVVDMLDAVTATSGISVPELVDMSTKSPSARLHASSWSDGSTGGSMWLFGANTFNRHSKSRESPNSPDLLSMSDEQLRCIGRARRVVLRSG
jgi:hypothetical protein